MINAISAFLNVILYFASVALFVALPEFTNLKWSILSFNILFSIFLIIFHYKKIKQSIKLKTLKFIVSEAFNIILIFSILGLISFFIKKNNLYFDLTKNKLNSLSDQSVKAVKQLSKSPLNIQLFSTKASRKRFLNLLNLYKINSKHVEISYVDIEENLAIVDLNKINENGTILVEYAGKTYRTVAINELAVTNLLIKILTPNRKTVYYSVGHNEMSLDSKNPIGGDFLQNKIEEGNYELKSLQLQYGVPNDAGLVLILNPQIEFLESEIESLEAYLKKGGSLLVTLAPSFNGIVIKKFMTFLKNKGIVFNNTLILDRLAEQQGAQASIPIVNIYSEHKITKPIKERTLFPISGHFSIMRDGIYNWKSLANSTPFPGSWGESNFQEVREGKASYNEGLDYKGPMPIVVAGESENSRVVMFSSANFISNQFQGQSTNFNLFMNSVGWLVREEALLSLNRPKLSGNIIYISRQQMDLIFYFAILIFPFFFFGIGIFMHHRKMNK